MYSVNIKNGTLCSVNS